MQRGSDRLSVHRDDEMKHELKELMRTGHPTRTEEWHDPEPAADDDPEVWRGPALPGRSSRASLEEIRLDLARVLGRGAFPAGPADLIRVLRRENAPDRLVELLEPLPSRARYGNAQELAEAVLRAGRP
ncbi:DUF2795 domain-containing protein [Streptomyces sp. NPDC047000]|uniref:DUF2795 domain-containing protein n=1 Tax=Streptomyces sp. NPDC047000 TaxID=3155474 RepID=UPI0033C9874B